MTKFRIMLASVLAIFMLLFSAAPALATTAYPSDFTCITGTATCSQVYNSGIDANVIKLVPGGKARTEKFSLYSEGDNVTLCITYVSIGNASPNLYNAAAVNVSFGVRSSWDTVCKNIYYQGVNLNLGAAGSIDKHVLVRTVTIN